LRELLCTRGSCEKENRGDPENAHRKGNP
jgi:hypothetical protein